MHSLPPRSPCLSNALWAEYYYDECFPQRLFTLKEIRRQYQSLTEMIPTDERTFAEYLFDEYYRNGGSLHPIHKRRKTNHD